MAKFTIEEVEDFVYGLTMKAWGLFDCTNDVDYDAVENYTDTKTFYFTFFNREFQIFANLEDAEIWIEKTTYRDASRRDEVAVSEKTVKTLRGLKGYMKKELDNEDLI